MPSNEQTVALLKQVQLFASLVSDREALEALASYVSERKFKHGSTILTEGELGEEFFMLVQGQVSIYKTTPDGDRYKVAVLNDSSVPTFGEGGLVEQEPRSATIIADNDCLTLCLNKQDLERFASQFPGAALPVYRQITTMLMQRLRKTSNDLMLLHKALMDEISHG